ncbi:hypothetical protein GALMADRAFT_207620 [Galerina marginata CBS 339.88]|uniref:RanBP2-type domain-containing protein n=1 Tax=Galerina marginata (strain CBS 339.88) TaxID=685588 RepID=A0A067TBK9_GALM3|nr:hypothetical protein GALMADRAFT_207620 [Galerina marginata CBS 339.88]
MHFSRPPLKPVEPINFRSQDPISSDPNSPRSPLSIGQMDTGTPENSGTFHFRFGSNSPSFTSPSPQTVTPSSSPKKKLARNPNGTYRWEGAGSAKHARPRNRYASPAFGVSPSKSERVILKDNSGLGETLSDSKRRKVGEESSTSSRLSASDSPNNPVPFPASSPTTPRTNGSTTRSTTSSPSRLRTPAKPTAPVVPSPLRQAWSDASSSSSRDDTQQGPPQPSKQTKTANYMAGLIKETTPPKKPDLSNPYQAASPVGKVGPPRRGTKRPRATGKPPAPGKDDATDEKKVKKEEKEKEKLNDYSPQAIIEATLPKGSKRSRPPARFEKRASSEETLESLPTQRETPVVVETRKVTYVVEEPDLDEDEARRSTKKVKPTVNGYGPPPSVKSKPSTSPPSDSDITIEEVDISMQSTEIEKAKELPKLTTQINGNASTNPASASSPTSRSSFSAFKPNSIPKEPSKLRYSFQAEVSSATSSPASTPTPLPQATPPPLPKSDFKFSPPSSDFTFKVDDKATSPKSQPLPIKPEGKENNPEMTVKAQVRAMNAMSLPVFAFALPGTLVFPSTPDHVKARNDAKALSKTALPTFDFGSEMSAVQFSFNYDPAKPKQGSHFNPTAPKQNKPFVLGLGLPTTPFTPPKPTASSAPVKGFDFAGAGMKVPTISKDAKACSLCGLSNPATASKCSTCEEPFFATTSQAPPVKAFDFAASGMKLPTVSKDAKACSLCGLSSPVTASKCSTCEEPFPASLPMAPPVKGFDFSAAGMKPPSASKDTWSCPSCALSSPAAAQECVVCGEPKP